MSLAVTLMLLLLIIIPSRAQSTTAAETIRHYTIAQKRLLLINTAQFANSITQNNLDQDSIVNIARDITAMPFLLPQNETFPGRHATAATDLVNNGSIHEAKVSVGQTTGDMRIQGLLEIALWYLHRDGTHRQDLDSASLFLQLASTESIATGRSEWQNECLLHSAELQYQKGNIEQSRRIFTRLAQLAIQTGQAEITAHAYMRIADLLSRGDTSRENYYYKSLNVYRKLGLKEKQMELLWKIDQYHEHRDFSLAKKDLQEILDLAGKTGFKHTLYAQNRLAWVLTTTEDYLGAINYAQAALENMKWSGLSDVQGTFYIRVAVAYANFGKIDECFQWFNKALVTATSKSHLFWYKSLLMLTPGLCFELNNPREALSIMDSVTRKFPPITGWEKLQVVALVGIFNEILNKTKLADKYFMELLRLANSNPLADPNNEMIGEYITISKLYVSRSNLPMARVFLKLAMVKEINSAELLSYKYSLYYKMDSLQGKYKSALQNHIRYKYYFDSSINLDQRKKMDELTVKYAAEKKDRDIKLLKQEGVARQMTLKQDEQVHGIMVAGTALLLVIAGMLFSQYRFKQRSNATMIVKNGILQHLLDEKEWLLKEVHHRVKNNLHTVISLLESQAAYLKDDALKAIENTQHRIFAMSLIHQKLYQGEDLKTIDMSVYLPEFIDYLNEGFGTHNQIRFQLNIEPVKLSVTQAIPIALIINEAVTNSIKYAFPDNRKGIIHITLHKDADQITFLTADNGIGMDKSLRNGASKTMGLKLIKGLSEDINGQMEIIDKNGTSIHINFPADPFAVTIL